MKPKHIIFIVLLFIVVVSCALVFGGFSHVKGITAQLISSQQFEKYAECIKEFSSDSSTDFDIIETQINSMDTIDDAIIIPKSGKLCGTAGCIAELCISNNGGSFTYIPFGFAVSKIEPREAINNGMRDLMINHNEKLTMSWDGKAYTLSSN